MNTGRPKTPKEFVVGIRFYMFTSVYQVTSVEDEADGRLIISYALVKPNGLLDVHISNYVEDLIGAPIVELI